MKNLKISKTKVFEALISATEITPYLRKLTKDSKKKADQSPLELQTQILLTLLEKRRQGLSFFELTQSLDLLNSDHTNDLSCLHTNSYDSIYVNTKVFTIDALGEETFRELSDALNAAKNPKKKPDYLIKRLIDIEQKKMQSMDCWQDICNKIISSQNDIIWERLENIMGKSDNHGNFIPNTQLECNNVIQLISRIGLSVLHPGFSVMQPLFFWLNTNYLNGDELSSEKLGWLRRAATRRLYSHLPLQPSKILDKEYAIFMDGFIDLTRDDECNNNMIQQITKTNSFDLHSAVELFSKLICDISLSLSLEHRLSIAYTILKFHNHELIKNLLLSMHRPYELGLLRDTYMAFTLKLHDKRHKETQYLSQQFELNTEEIATLSLKMMVIRMAKCIALIDKENTIYIAPDIVAKALSVIKNHNDIFRNALSKHKNNDAGEDKDDFYNLTTIRDLVSHNEYIATPATSVNNDSTIVSCNQDLLLMPTNKHLFLINGEKKYSRRYLRTQRDNDKLLHDYLCVSRNTDLARTIDWLSMDVPVSYLFPGKDSVCIQHPRLMDQLTEALSMIDNLRDAKSEKQHLLTIKFLFDLSCEVKRNKIDFYEEIRKKLPSQELEDINPLLEVVRTFWQSLQNGSERKQIIEYVSCLLFDRLSKKETTVHINFNDLMRVLYILNSRAKNLIIIINNHSYLEFSDCINNSLDEEEYLTFQINNKIKNILSRNFHKSLFCLDDDRQGHRIKTSLINAFRKYQGGGYEQLIDNLLEEIKPMGTDSNNESIMSSHKKEAIANLIYKMKVLSKKRANVNDLINKNRQLARLTTHNNESENKLSEEILDLLLSVKKSINKFHIM